MIIKAWVKFNGMDIECICTENRRKECGPEYECEKYVVKFIPIMSLESETKDLSNSVNKLSKAASKFSKEMEKLSKKRIR